jgi:transposase
MRKLTFICNDEEKTTLAYLATAHPKDYFRVRGKALISLLSGQTITETANVLQIQPQSIRNWIHLWDEEGLIGILKSRKGGAKAKLTDDLIQIAVEQAKKEPMSLAQIAEYVRQFRPDAPEFSLDRLGVRLRENGLTYKRTRYSLKKKGSGAL